MNVMVQTFDQKREFISRKIIIGIDPAKDKHQVRIIDFDKRLIESPNLDRVLAQP